jgi:parallel beta-helix repeat protein
MASSIQLLRSNVTRERPLPGNLLDGQPAINTSAEEPGLFFKASDGSLVKVGPVSITDNGNPPNSGPVGFQGNSKGELWLDKSLPSSELKVFDGAQWVTASGGGPAVSSDFVSVKDYGAKGDGVTDDTSSIRNAILAAAGRIVIIPPGTYIVNNAIINNTAGIYLSGVPGQTTFKRTTAFGSMFVDLRAPEVSVYGIIFDFNKAQVLANQWGLSFSRPGCKVFVDRCVFKDNGGSIGSGISFFSTTGSLDANGSITIQNCEVSGCDWEGIFIASKENITIRNNYVHDNQNTGIGIRSWLVKSVTNYSTNALIANNRVERNGNGISIGGFGPPYDFSVPAATYVTVCNNFLADNYVQLGLQGHHVSCFGNKVYRVDPAANIYAGVFLNGQYTDLFDNYFNQGQTTWGIDIGGSSYCNIINNTVFQLGGALLNVGGTENCVVRGNYVSANGGPGFCCVVYDIEADGSGRPFPTVTSGLIIEENSFYWDLGDARGINLVDDAGGSPGKIPTIISRNQFFPRGSGSDYYAVYALSPSVKVYNNLVNGNDYYFLGAHSAEGNLVFPMVYENLITSNASGAIFPINSIITQVQNEYRNNDRILFIHVTNGGSGYTSQTTISATGGGTGLVAIPLIKEGSIIGVRVTNSGSGYTGPVTIVASDPGGGNGATFVTGKFPLLTFNKKVNVASGSSNVIKGTGGLNPLSSLESALLSSGASYSLYARFNTPGWRLETNQLPVLGSPANLPAASADLTGAKCYIRSSTSNMFFARCDGTNWRFADGSIVS